MAERKELGKIEEISLGFGGYQDTEIGIRFTLSGKGFGVCDWWGEYAGDISDNSDYTKVARLCDLGKVTMRIANLLGQIKKQNFEDLKGVPVEVTFENSTLKSWRILTEVL